MGIGDWARSPIPKYALEINIHSNYIIKLKNKIIAIYNKNVI